MAANMIDVHFHLILQFYRDAVYEADGDRQSAAIPIGRKTSRSA